MSDWLPSLNALRAFEAVSRYLSYAQAAEDLRVTPAAVKQLVDKLELAIGQELVKRKGRGLALTAAGLAGREALSAGFAELAMAVARMRKHSGRQRLIVSAEPTLAFAWLVPRLEKFRKDNADIDVLIDSSSKIADLQRGDADVAIRFGKKPGSGLVSQRLFDERLCAFCSPPLARSKPGLRRLKDLERATLLHWDMSGLGWASATRRWMSWQSWLEKAGVRRMDVRQGITFSDYNLLLQSAVAGQGVMLGSLPVLHDLLVAGLLADPFGVTVETNIGYDVVAAPLALDRREVKRFVDWISAEACPGAKPLRGS
jgi:LysR family glycine cleavage system transcriptional activator